MVGVITVWFAALYCAASPAAAQTAGDPGSGVTDKATLPPAQTTTPPPAPLSFTSLSRRDTAAFDAANATTDFHRAATSVLVGSVTASFCGA